MMPMSMPVAAWVAAVVLAQQPSWSAALTLERARESLRYRFDNPSSFDTPALVPHFFEQTYDMDNGWLGLRLRHPLFGHEAEARISVTPQATRRANDFDTFFQPDGNVVVSGTTGNASIRSWRVEERITLGHVRDVALGVALGYRHDSARYHDGIGIVTTTVPSSETRRLVTTRELVTSRMFEGGLFVSAQSRAFAVTADVMPAAGARLRIDLPDKYPGRLIVFGARYSAAAAEVRYARRIGAARVGLGVRAQATWPWRHSAAVHRRSLGLFFELGPD